ncbi:Cholera toxin secretion protein epsL [Campylobacter jejuni]|nr:Cholera toxin secretion protein epsL [Campylobacter jejuni]
MNEQVIVRLGSRLEDPVPWLVWSASGLASLANGELANAGELGTLVSWCQKRELIILIPGCDVVLTSLSFPGKINQRTRLALPFLLEEDIASEPEHLHLVILARERSILHIAAVEHEQMQQWLGWCHQAGLMPGRIIPDVLALPPREAGGWTVLHLGTQWLARQSQWQGTVIDDVLLEPWLQGYPQLPPIHSHSPLPACARESWEHGEYQNALPLLAQNLPDNRVDLMQRAFGPAPVWQGRLAAWRLPALLTAALVVAWGLCQCLDYYRLSAQQQALQQQINTLYRQTFPTEKKVIDPYMQFKQRLGQREGSGPNTGLLSLLSTVGRAFDAPSGLVIHSIKYDEAVQQLQMLVSGPSFAAVKQIGAKTSESYAVELGELAEKDGSVSGWIKVKGR